MRQASFFFWAFQRDPRIQNRVLAIVGLVSAIAISLSLVFYAWTVPDIGVRTAFSLEIVYFNKEFQVNNNEPVPEPKDIIHALNDKPILSWPQFLRELIVTDQLNPQDAEKGVPVVVLEWKRPSNGKLFKASFLLGKTSVSNMMPSFLWLALKMAMVCVGAIIFWFRPLERAPKLFFVLGIVSLIAYLGGYHWWRIATQPMLLLLFMSAALFLPAVSLHFFMIFPKTKKILSANPLAVLGTVYGVPGLFLVLLISGYVRIRWVGGEEMVTADGLNLILKEMLLEIFLFLGIAVIWFLGSIICLLDSYRKASDNTERNQVKWILLGCVAALFPIVYSAYLVIMDPSGFSQGGATWPMFVASFFVTASFSVSITRYKLLQLDQAIASGFSFFLFSFTAGLVYYGLVFVLMLIAGTQFISHPTFSQVGLVSGTAMVLILVLDRLRGRILSVLDRRYLKEKTKLDLTFRKMSEAVESLVDPKQLARRLLLGVSETIGVRKASVYLSVPEGGYNLVDHLGVPPKKGFVESSLELVKRLSLGESYFVGFLNSSHEMGVRKEILGLGGQVVVPLLHEKDLRGFLLLGVKDSGVFSIDDLNLCAAFAQLTVLGFVSSEGHQLINQLNEELRAKVEKIAEQQNRILALQTQLTRKPVSVETIIASSDTLDNAGSIAKTDNDGGSLGRRFGGSDSMRAVFQLAQKVAPGNSAVLVRGESGVGKEVLAQLIHEMSPRATKPLIKVHCAALSQGVLESELFGHIKGAFTNAIKDKIGRFEAANGGTIFLDEIGDISPEIQVKLLRVLQDKVIEKVGSNQSIKVDVRVIAATHQDLESLISKGRFRGDLFYRLNVFPITIPPLRDRAEDIVELAAGFLEKFAKENQKDLRFLEDDAIVCMKAYTWPGNVRELENAIERAVVMSSGDTLTLKDLPDEIANLGMAPQDQMRQIQDSGLIHTMSFSKMTKEEFLKKEKDKISMAMEKAGGNKAKAARALGVARSTLVSRMKKLGLD